LRCFCKLHDLACAEIKARRCKSRMHEVDPTGLTHVRLAEVEGRQLCVSVGQVKRLLRLTELS
jgi:hypothetical protein